MSEYALAYQADAGPLIAEIRQTAAQLVLCSRLPINDGPSYQESGELILQLKQKLKTYNEQRLELTRPLDGLKAKWLGIFKPFVDALDSAIDDLDRRRNSYRKEKEAEERRLREEALKEQARLQKKADREAAKLDEKGQHELADIKRTSVPEIMAPAIVAHDVPKTAGIHTRENWLWACATCGERDCEHLRAALPREHLRVNEASVGRMVRELKGLTRIQGVRVWMEESSVAGRSEHVEPF